MLQTGCELCVLLLGMSECHEGSEGKYTESSLKATVLLFSHTLYIFQDLHRRDGLNVQLFCWHLAGDVG